VAELVTLHSLMIDTTSEHSLFRGMLYNKFPKEMPADQKKFYRDNIPVTINGTPTDFQKFLKANQKCKDDSYVVQINSIEELA
jgi:hypothetical protein